MWKILVVLSTLIFAGYGDKQVNENYNGLQFDAKCFACKMTAEVILAYHRYGNKNPQELFNIVTALCSFFGGMDKQVCHGMIQNVGEQLFAILTASNGTISAQDICGMVLGGYCAEASKRLSGWSLEIPDLDSNPPTQPPVWPSNPKSTHKILHLSDPHLQLDYKVGSNAACDQVICCTDRLGPPKNRSDAAGQFGDYRCDLPMGTFGQILASARASNPDIDFIFLTGDYPAHDVWRQDRAHNKAAARAVVDAVGQHFPHVPVFPAIGNHEVFPVNMFPVEDPGQRVPAVYNPAWIYDYLADLYEGWLPGSSQQATLRDSGYYSIMVTNKLRLLSMNTNFCNNFNFWLLLNFTDPHRHLHWLYRQLHKAENNKEKVVILGHIAPGTHSCLGRWSHEYNRVVKRFRNTISAQFFGHTHFDEFQIFFKDNDKPINMAYLAPSETSVDGLNPAYRIYTMDEDSKLIVDHTTYWLDLRKANEQGRASMALEYSAKAGLGLDDLSPASWFEYVERLAKNDTEFGWFLDHYYRSGPARNSKPCDQTCKETLLCDLLTSKSQLDTPPAICDVVKDKLNYYSTWWQYWWPA